MVYSEKVKGEGFLAIFSCSAIMRKRLHDDVLYISKTSYFCR